MKKFAKILIDMTLFKFIQSKRDSFSETPNDILKRVLRVKDRTASQVHLNGAGITVQGVHFKEGQYLTVTFKGEEYFVQVLNGKFNYEGKKFTAPSTVGKAITGYWVDGWKFFRTINPETGGEVCLKELRKDGVRTKRVRSNFKKNLSWQSVEEVEERMT